jgi:hypothetical protein
MHGYETKMILLQNLKNEPRPQNDDSLYKDHGKSTNGGTGNDRSGLRPILRFMVLDRFTLEGVICGFHSNTFIQPCQL